MKKLIIVMLVAVLASSFAFAALTGNATIQFKGDFDKKEFGFVNNNPVGLSAVVKWTSDGINILGEDPIHVELAAGAEFQVIDKNGNFNFVVGGKYDKEKEDKDKWTFSTNNRLTMWIEYAKIAGENWWVDITGAKGAYDSAAAGLLKTDDGYATYSAVYNYDPAPGFTANYAGFTGSFGFWKDKSGLALSGTIETPEFKFAEDAVTVQVAAGGGKDAGAGFASAGVSANATVNVQDTVTLNVAGDFGLENITKDFDNLKFAGDASVSGSYKFVSASAYVFAGSAGVAMLNDPDGYQKLYLEAQAKVNLKDFDVPVTVGVSAQNIVDVNDKPTTIGAEAEYAKDAITAGVAGHVLINGGFAGWDANVYGQYAAEKFTAGASVGVSGPKAVEKLSAGVYAQTGALVNGATFGVSYGYTTITADLKTAKDTSKFGNDFIGDDHKYGQAGVYCQIKF